MVPTSDPTPLLPDPEVLVPDTLFPDLYDELKQLARNQLRQEKPGHSLNPSDLLHMAYERLRKTGRSTWETSAEFKRVASRVMRNLLVDHARAKKSLKRGGRWTRIQAGDIRDPGSTLPQELLAIDEALTRLGGQDPRAVAIFECRYFGGLRETEAARACGLSPRTGRRLYALAKAWLKESLIEEVERKRLSP